MFVTTAKSRFAQMASTLLVFIAFLYPLGMGIVQHWSSGFLIAAVSISALVLGRNWVCTEGDIKVLIAGIVMFIMISAVSFINAADISSSFDRLGKLAFLLFTYPLYLVIKRLKVNLLRPLYYGLLAAGPVYAITAFYYVYHLDYSRVHGFYSPIIFGSSAMVIALLILSGYWGGISTRVRPVFIWFSFFCAVGATIASGTKGAWLALPVIFVLWLIIFLRDLSIRRIFSVLLLVVSVLLLFSFNDHAKDRTEEVFTDFNKYSAGGGANTSLGARLYLWEEAVLIWQLNPIIGTGLGDFRRDIRQRVESNKTPLVRNYTHAHNIFLDALATTGIMGFLGMITAVFVVPASLFFRVRYLDGKKKITCHAIMGFTLLVSFAVFGLTEGWTIHSPMVSSFTFLLAVLLPSRTSAPVIDS